LLKEGESIFKVMKSNVSDNVMSREEEEEPYTVRLHGRGKEQNSVV